MNTLLKSHIPLETYGKPLAQSHIIFLTKDDHRGLSNTSQTRMDIMKNVQGSLRQVHEVMKYTKNLKESEINETFNAQNLEELFENLLKDPQYNSISEVIPKKYDIRTSEIARVMVAVGLKYLTQSEKYKDDKKTLEDAQSINDDFERLTGTLFSEEFKTTKQDEQMEIVQSHVWKSMGKRIEKLEHESPIPIYDPIDPEQKSNLQTERKETLDELFAIHNKLEFTKNAKEKKELKKQQNEYRFYLDTIDKTLKALEEKEMLYYLQTEILLSSHKDVESILSRKHSSNLTNMVRKSRKILEFINSDDQANSISTPRREI